MVRPEDIIKKDKYNDLRNLVLICEAMDEFGEQVKQETISKMLSSNAKDREVFYSKEQVDALLNSQARECYNKAKIEFIKDDYSNCYVRDYGDFTSMLARVNKDSILNAKLKLE